MMIKSLVAHIRFSKVLVLAAATVSGAVLAGTLTDQSPLNQQDLLMIEASKAIADDAKASGMPDWLSRGVLSAEEGRKEAQQFVQQLQMPDPSVNPLMGRQETPEESRERYSKEPILIFASRSLGEKGLEELLVTASHNPDSVVVFRGIPEHANLGQAIAGLQQFAASLDPVPNIVINPMLFTDYNVTTVPTIIIRKDQPVAPGKLPEEQIRVSGLINPGWLKNRAEAGEEGDLGVRGPVAQISEPDIIELMKQRYARIDWDKERERAAANFWKKQVFTRLPEAHEDRTRELDPSIYITEDIKSKEGQVIAVKGSTINPLHLSDFTQALVIFDPLDADQVERVKAALPGIAKTPGVQKITYIVTQLDQDEGWESYKSVTDAFDAPVFLLTSDVLNRFELEYVPSIVTAKGDRFIIQELADREGAQ